MDSIRRGDVRNEFVSHEETSPAQTFPAKFHSKSSAEEEEEEEEKTIIAMVIKMATFSRAFEKRFRQVPFPEQLRELFLSSFDHCIIAQRRAL